MNHRFEFIGESKSQGNLGKDGTNSVAYRLPIPHGILKVKLPRNPRTILGQEIMLQPKEQKMIFLYEKKQDYVIMVWLVLIIIVN